MASPRPIPANLLANARAMRKESAPAEAILWNCLRDRQLGGYKFRRQSPVPPFIADLRCAALGLVIELDGDSHSENQEYDARRTTRIELNGHHVIRFLNSDVFDHLDSVLEEILRECEQLDVRNHPHPNPLPDYRGTGPETRCRQ